MRHFLAGMTAFTALLATLAVPAWATEATFERNLTVSGRVDLAINNGSGFIHLTNGPAGHVHIFARVHSSWGTSDDAVQEIAAHPPVQQIGNIVRIGAIHRALNNVNIDYEIQAPADAYLDAASGSGNITDDGVGANAKLSTGSGSIQATGLKGGFTVGTGSGNIDAEQVSPGDVKANTGSGSIELKNLHGGLHAGTGSGHVKVEGSPTASWRIHTGSGGVELWTENAGLTLDASTGSGGIHTDREISSQGTIDHHHVKGTIRGGGPEVRVETGSGSIKVH
jgi:hypothetical protein